MRIASRLLPAFVAVVAFGCAPGAEKKEGGGAANLLSGPYAISPAADGATVCWQTSAAETGAVRFRAAGNPEWTRIDGEKATRFHAVRVSGLKPGTTVEVEVLGAGGAKIGALSFRTYQPKDAAPFSFFVYGDTRGNPSMHSRIAAEMALAAERSGKYAFILNTGDLATFGSDEERTAVEFFIPAAPLLARMPLICVPGNHEMGSDLFGKYFPEQGVSRREGNPFDVCVDCGPVRVIGIDQYARKPFAGDRARWLEKKLAEAGDMWRIVAIHEPIYSSGSHGSAIAF
ncbi:MAG: metallophosphoesterase family protein, partial [Planctomycetota bacterium]|nr:metallophosphoesterase family protein [Planctomycetota bacterium]